MEAQRSNKVTTWSLIDEREVKLLESGRVCEAFQQHFARLFDTAGGSERKMDFNAKLHSLPRLSVRGAKCWEKPVRAAYVRDVMAGCTVDKSPGLNGLPYELYFCMPDLLGGVLAAVYCN